MEHYYVKRWCKSASCGGGKIFFAIYKIDDFSVDVKRPWNYLSLIYLREWLYLKHQSVVASGRIFQLHFIEWIMKPHTNSWAVESWKDEKRQKFMLMEFINIAIVHLRVVWSEASQKPQKGTAETRNNFSSFLCT